MELRDEAVAWIDGALMEFLGALCLTPSRLDFQTWLCLVFPLKNDKPDSLNYFKLLEIEELSCAIDSAGWGLVYCYS